ncbi:MAG: hypothetical protein M3304_03745 [Actinomycetota bacterium]|nr:hypothetical protein [Actinomycetota bacterium]
MRLELGTPIRCTDGPFGELADVVVDPTRRRVTHLVVEPHHRHHLARLVPVDLVANGDGSSPGIALACTVEDVRHLDPVEEFAYLGPTQFSIDDPDWDVGVQDVLALPYYDYEELGGPTILDPHVSFVYDRIPKGEVEIRRTSAVTSSDDHHLGHVDGFLVDANDDISHVVLERGHLWGRREVTIPIGAVARVENDSVTLRLTKDAVGGLPAIRVRRSHT